MVYAVDVTEYCEKYFILSLITHSNILQILLNFIEMKSSTSIIFVPNMKEIEIREHSFQEFKIFKNFLLHFYKLHLLVLLIINLSILLKITNPSKQSTFNCI